MTLAEFWSLCPCRLHEMLPAGQFAQWIMPLAVGEENDIWVVYGKDQFACNILKSQFTTKIDAVRVELMPQQTMLASKPGIGTYYGMIARTVVPVQVQEAIKVGECIEPVQMSLQTVAVMEEDGPSETVPKPAAAMTATEILAQRMKNLSHESQVQTAAPAGSGVVAKVKATVQHNAEEARYEQTSLPRNYIFETLVEGKDNRFTTAAIQAITKNPGRGYSPSFPYGNTGLGKTHLVQAIGNELLKDRPDAKVRYTYSNDYVHSFMKTVRDNTYDVSKQQYKQYNLLIIDDIQFIKGKDRTIEELFYLYNHFHNEKKQLILMCDILPAKIEGMGDRFKPRFSWGLALELEPPELKIRVTILQKKVEAAGISIENKVALFIVNLIHSNVHELEGASNRISASSRFMNRSVIDMDLTHTALQDVTIKKRKVIIVDTIIDAVAKYYHIKINDILGKKRTRNIARPRQVTISLAKELTMSSLSSIGGAFGRHGHAIAMHGVKTAVKLCEEGPGPAQDYKKLLILIQN